MVGLVTNTDEVIVVNEPRRRNLLQRLNVLPHGYSIEQKLFTKEINPNCFLNLLIVAAWVSQEECSRSDSFLHFVTSASFSANFSFKFFALVQTNI